WRRRSARGAAGFTVRVHGLRGLWSAAVEPPQTNSSRARRIMKESSRRRNPVMFSPKTALLIGVMVLSLVSNLPGESGIEPPVANRVDHRDVRHGATVVDNYYWLREKSNPEVVKYLEAENAYTEAMTKNIKDFEESLYKEMLGRIKQTDLSVPVRHG